MGCKLSSCSMFIVYYYSDCLYTMDILTYLNVSHDIKKKAVYQERLRAAMILRLPFYHTCIGRKSRAGTNENIIQNSTDGYCMHRKEEINKMDGERLLRTVFFKIQNNYMSVG